MTEENVYEYEVKVWNLNDNNEVKVFFSRHYSLINELNNGKIEVSYYNTELSNIVESYNK